MSSNVLPSAWYVIEELLKTGSLLIARFASRNLARDEALIIHGR